MTIVLPPLTQFKGALLWDEAQADKLVESFKSGGKTIVTYCT